MAQNKAVAAVKFLEKRLVDNNLNISKIILFGSQVGGRASAESDVDIVLVSEDFKNKSIFKRLELIKEAEIATIKKFVIPLDIIMMTPEEFEDGASPVSEYARNGEVLFTA